MKKLMLVIFSSIVLFQTPKIFAVTHLYDSFLNGGEVTNWSIIPGLLHPVTSAYGIIDTNDSHAYGLFSTPISLPNVQVVKFTMKVHSHPSFVMFSCKNAQNFANEKRASLLSDGSFFFEAFINGGGDGGPRGSWDMTPGTHQIELDCLGSNMILKEDGQQLGIWDNGFDFPATNVRFQYEQGDSEFANYILCDSLTCDPPISPSPINEPTPQPLPSITPSPGITNTKKVIVIPGFGGSFNEEAIVRCKTETYSGIWTSWSLSDQTYQTLFKNLKAQGYTPLPFYYDWRQQPLTQVQMLKNFIKNQVGETEKVHIVAHSMGGQIARAYVEQEKEHSNVEKLMTIGTPHQGVVFTYPVWSSGTIINSILNIQWKAALMIDMLACRANGKKGSDREIVQQTIPSVQTFLPTFPYLFDKKSGQMKSVDKMLTQNPWLFHNTNFSPPYFGITMGTLSGKGQSTLRTISVKSPSQKDIRLGNWLDGMADKYITENQGDGLVLLTSSQLPQADNRSINGSHSDLVTSQRGIKEILSFLSNTPTDSQPIIGTIPEVSDTSLLAIVSTETDFSTTTLDSQKSTTKLKIIQNPPEGDFKVNFSHNPEGSLIYLQITEDGQVKANTYNLKLMKRSGLKFKFNKKIPVEEPLVE